MRHKATHAVKKSSPAAAAPAKKAQGAARAPTTASRKAAAEPPGEALLAIRALHTLVQSRLPAPAAGDQALEGAVDSLRRLLSELIEARTESVAADVAALRRLSTKPRGGHELTEAIDALLAKLGAIRFEAKPLDFVDPLIHRVVAEREGSDAADGVILEAAQPGFKTARGAVLSKADVIVNRRT